MIQGKLLSFGDDLEEVYNIRRKVFVEELNISEIIEFNQTDKEAIHVLVYEEISNLYKKEKLAIATGRIEYDGTLCKISHIAVIKEFRRRKYGDFTVRMLINKAFTSGIKEVILYSPLELIDFFKTIGFKINGTISEKDKNLLYIMTIHMNNIKTLCKK